MGCSFPVYLTENTVGHNAQVHDISVEEREHLGAVEYRANLLLSCFLTVYQFGTMITGTIVLGLWFSRHTNIDNLRPDPCSMANANCTDWTLNPKSAKPVNPWFLAAFLSVSAFTNTGMSLLDDNVVSLHSCYSLRDGRNTCAV